MSTEIQKTEELTDQRRWEIYREAKALYADTVAMGTRLLIQRAAALHNLKHSQAYRADGYKSWVEFCASVDIDKSQSYQYLGIARAIIGSTGCTEPETFLFKKQDIEDFYKHTSQAFRQLDWKQLTQLAKRVDVFSEAMTGAELLKLLPPKEATNEEMGDERKKQSETADFNDHMAKALAPYGWIWNAKARRCEHADGTPLTDEEIAQVTHPDSAFHVFRQASNRLDSVLGRVMDDIVHDMATYMRYAKAIPNQALDRKVMELRNDVQEKFQTIIQMLDALISCDERRVKEIRKHGLEAA